MTDREILFALLGLLGNNTDLTLGSLKLLHREIPVTTILDCKQEMDQFVRNLATLSEPRASAFIKEMLDEIKRMDK